MPIVVGAAAVLLALMALLVIYGLQSVLKAFSAAVVSHIPVIGGKIAQGIDVGLTFSQLALTWLVGDVVRPAIAFVVAPVLSLEQWMRDVEGLAGSIDGTLGHMFGTEIPRALRGVEAYALRLRASAEAYAHRLYGAALTYAHNLYRDALAYVRTEVHNLSVALSARIAAVHQLAYDLYHDGQAYADRAARGVLATAEAKIVALSRTLTADINAVDRKIIAAAGAPVSYVDAQAAKALTAAEAFAARQVGIAVTDIDHEAATAIGQVWPDVTAGVKGVEGVIDGGLADILSGLQAIPGAIPGDLASTLAGLGALSIPMLRYMEECGVPNCRNLSQYGRDLQDLLGVFADGGLLALFIGLATAPEATAHDVQDVLVPVIDAAADGARTLIGV